MTKMYQTELDGMRNISTADQVEANDYVFIKDDIYKDDITLFKNKKTDGNKLDLKLVKLAEIRVLPKDELEKFKFNQLYKVGEVVFTAQTRLSKNQLLQLGERFYVVDGIVKHKDRPQELELTQIPYIIATNMYGVYKREKNDSEKKLYKMCSSFGEAFGLVLELRSKKEECFYSL